MQKLSLLFLAFAIIALFVAECPCGETTDEILTDVSGLTRNESAETKVAEAPENSLPENSDDIVKKAKWTFKLYKRRKTWNNARKFCLAKRGQLVVIDSAEKQATLRSRLDKETLEAVWIGFHDLFEEGSWTTVTDELVDELDYNPWAKGEPNNSGNLQHCAIIWRTNITDGVDDYRCDGKFAFACENKSC